MLLDILKINLTNEYRPESKDNKRTFMYLSIHLPIYLSIYLSIYESKFSQAKFRSGFIGGWRGEEDLLLWRVSELSAVALRIWVPTKSIFYPKMVSKATNIEPKGCQN